MFVPKNYGAQQNARNAVIVSKYRFDDVLYQ